MEGYQITVKAKPFHIVNKTFSSIPTDGANYRYLVRLIFGGSTELCELAKIKGIHNDGSAASLMFKSVKTRRGKRSSFYIWDCISSHHGDPSNL